MIDEGIRDGDYIIVESRDAANQGETVVALIGDEATVKKYFREDDGRVRLQPPIRRWTRFLLKKGTCISAASWLA